MAVHLNKLYERWGRRPDWMDEAACVGEPTEVFFPTSDDDAWLAKKICSECPVRVDCLDYALTNHRGAGDAGVWGGTTEGDRARIRRREAKARAKARAVAPVTSVT